ATEGIASAHQVALAAAEAGRRGVSLGEVLASDHVSDEAALYLLLAAHHGLSLADPQTVLGALDPLVMRSVPEAYQERKRLLPVARRNGTLLVASPDPNPRTLDLADALDARRVKLLLVTPTDFRRLRWAAVLEQIGGKIDGTGMRPVEDLLEHDIKLESRHAGLVDALLADAVGERASDIHIERYSDNVRVRMRIDGELHDIDRYHLSAADAAAMISVVKVRADLDIAERRRPQGGRFSEKIGGLHFDLRVQTLPSPHGECLAVRLLPQERELFTLESLGLSKTLRRLYRRVLAAPSGLVLVAGPTGCGKSTTLYAGLQLLARDRTRKVITVEDPIEYSIEGIHQTQVRNSIGYSFASSVRSFVRHDPDVIFVGEIRDYESAQEALRASQTGHLVLSTIHANDSVDAIQRLHDLGVHPNSIAAELRAVLSQRLAKRVCPNCAEVEPLSQALEAELFPKGVPDDFRSLRGAGCNRCRGRGYYGRIAVTEFLNSTRDLRVAIAHTRPLDELREVAALAGHIPLRDHALELIRDGIVAASSLPRVVPIELLRSS
ncbi:MAG: type II/IV secretion system protein, partial [Myxococcales bacterium]|nr:type II/IV secretion system protein [Myxococcales bacterium]